MIAWRWRALEQQLPAASFPAGTAAPSLVYLWATMVVVVAAVLGFAIHDQTRVPVAVQQSQRDLVAKVARSMNVSTQRAVEELDLTLASIRRTPTLPPAQLLSRVIGDGETWTGAVLIETASRKPLGTAGVRVDLGLLPQVLPPDGTLALATAEAPALVRVSPLDATRTVVAVQPLLMRNLRLNPDAQHGVFMLTPDGKTTVMQGVSAVDQELLATVFQGLPNLRTSTTRAIAVEEWTDRQLVVSAAPIGDTGVVVVSMIVSPVTAGMSVVRGLLLGVSLLAVALFAFLLMRKTLVQPVQTLLRQAKLDACGAQTDQRPSLRIAEMDRIARALAITSGGGLRSTGWRTTAMKGVVAAAALGMLWPIGAVLTTLGAEQPEIPAQLVYDEESRAEAVAAVLGNALDNGLATVMRTAQRTGTADAAAVQTALRDGLRDDHRLRSLYQVDRAGKVLHSAGRPALRPLGPLPGTSGIRLDPAVRRLPVFYAYKANGSTGAAVVGEYDIDYLVGLMRSQDGRARVVDPELHTLLDSEGYNAFQPLAGDTASEVAIEALAGGTVGRARTPDGEPALGAAASLLNPPTVAHLELVVIVERDIAALQLPEIVSRRWTLLVAGAMAGIIGLTLAWQFFIFIRPLRRLAAAADKMCAGALDEPIPPQRHDDIGGIAMCLEICRQVRHTGSARFGGAIRLRGSEENFTAVLPRIPKQGGRSGRAAKADR